jgi:hypothetical protein
VAGIVVAERVRYADDRALERVVGVAHGFDEGFAQKKRETSIAVAGEPFS